MRYWLTALNSDRWLDPNRPTWEQYKKDNEDKLDMVGQEVRKMVEYRAKLDSERDERLREARSGKKTSAISDSDDENEESSTNEESSSASRKKKEKKHKKLKKHKVPCLTSLLNFRK